MRTEKHAAVASGSGRVCAFSPGKILGRWLAPSIRPRASLLLRPRSFHPCPVFAFFHNSQNFLPSLLFFYLVFCSPRAAFFVFLFSVPFFTSVRIRPLVCFYFRSLPLFRSLFVCFRGETRPAPINFPKSRRPQVVTLFIFAPWHTQNSHKKKLKKHKKTTGDLIVARKVEK